MINQYDELQEMVKHHEAVMKGKAKSTGNLASLGMKVILQKNREMKHAKKQQISKIIQARKLKIKIGEVLNIKNSYHAQFAIKSQKQNGKNINQNNHQKNMTANFRNQRGSSLNQTKKIYAQSLKRSFQKGLPFASSSMTNRNEDGTINIFDKFTQQELNQIQQDEKYYLGDQETIAIFQKYMLRKRLNNKDYSYQKFGIKPDRSRYVKNQEDIPFDRKSYILKTLKIEQTPNTKNNELHLLTNPLSFTQTANKFKSKSLLSLRESRKNIINLLKDKQTLNKQKLVLQQNEKILNLRIDRNYFDGLAAQKRAMHKDKLMNSITKRNKDHDERSLEYRQRIKTVRENLGKSIELAESIRTEIFKRRTHNKHNNRF